MTTAGTVSYAVDLLDRVHHSGIEGKQVYTD